MKKITGLFFCVFLLTASSVLAETPSIAAGNLEFGIGNLFSYSKIMFDDTDYDLFNIGTFGEGSGRVGEGILYPFPSFSVSYFIIDGLGLGVLGGYNYLKGDDSDDATHSYFIGPEVKFYIAVTDSVLIDVHGAFVYNGSSEGDSDSSQANVQIGAGLNYLFTKNFAACVGIDYAYFFERKRDGSTVEDSDVNRVTFSVGLKAFVTFNE